MIDAALDLNMAGKAPRNAWKTVLGVAGIYLNILSLTEEGGKFASREHLTAYVGALIAVTSFGLYKTSK